MAKEILEKELLEDLQEACEALTKSYKERTGKKVRFEVIQLSKIAHPQEQRDIVRELAQLYDEFEGNENYIHIPDISQMAYNLKNYPIIVVVNEETGEIDGATTIKFHNNVEGDIDPYYPKPGVKFYSITGVIVRQRKFMENRGLGTGMYEAGILGLQKYATSHPNENIEVNCVIDFTNLKSMYAFANANNNIDARGLVGQNKELISTLDGIYVVQDFETRQLVEAPTAVLRTDLVAKERNQLSRRPEKTCRQEFSFSIDKEEKVYLDILKEIMKKLKPSQGHIKKTTMIDKGAGYVTYIPNQNRIIQVEDIVIYPNGTENVGNKRVPRNDVDKFVGPTQNFWIKTEKNKDEDER